LSPDWHNRCGKNKKPREGSTWYFVAYSVNCCNGFLGGSFRWYKRDLPSFAVIPERKFSDVKIAHKRIERLMGKGRNLRIITPETHSGIVKIEDIL